MMRKSVLAAGILLTCLGLAASAGADVIGGFTMDFVPISGDASAANGTVWGTSGDTFSDPDDFRMAKYEVTNAQWDAFVAAHGAPTGTPAAAFDKDPTASGANKPVNNASFLEAVQFVNWLNTITGNQAAYNVFEATPGDPTTRTFGVWDAADAAGGTNLYRHKDAMYFLPTLHEVLKAAYWNGTSLQTYANATDTLPTPAESCFSASGGLWDVGSGAVELNATFDMMGNMGEIQENDVNFVYPTGAHMHRFGPGCYFLPSSFAAYGGWTGFNGNQSAEYDFVGLRVAALDDTPKPPHLEALEVFYNGKYADAADPAKSFLAVGEASSMSLIGDDLHGNVTNYAQGITGIRVKFDAVVAFSGGVAAAFSYEATPEQSADKTFTVFTPPTAPVYVVDDSSGKTVVTITFTDGEIKNRWLKTIIDASQVSANSMDLDGELAAPLTLPSGNRTPGGNAEFIIGNRLGDVDANYRCLLNDAITIRSRVSGALVGISNTFDIDKNQRILLNEAIGARNAVSGTALPALP